MTDIKWTIDHLKANLSEAKEYIEKAYQLFESDRQCADWCKDMALGHLQFNSNGRNVFASKINAFKTEEKNTELAIAVYNGFNADIMKESAWIKSMIDNYGK